jgi:hypothetical protein
MKNVFSESNFVYLFISRAAEEVWWQGLPLLWVKQSFQKNERNMKLGRFGR